MTMPVRGVILAGGKGTRLGELTRVTNKHLLPIGEYPMVYHPLKKMVGAGIQDILLVSGTEHMGDFVELFGSGKSFGCRLTYRVQDEAGGIAQALSLAEQFCKAARSVVILGDNIFADPLTEFIELTRARPDDAAVMIKRVPDPGRYGVAELSNGRILGIEEKPANPKSDCAVAGIYSYPPEVFEVIRTLKPSGRGELEITDVNNHYVRTGKLVSWEMPGYWTDAGTLASLHHANELVRQEMPRFE